MEDHHVQLETQVQALSQENQKLRQQLETVTLEYEQKTRQIQQQTTQTLTGLVDELNDIGMLCELDCPYYF